MIFSFAYGNITACTTTMPNFEISVHPLTEIYAKNVNLSVDGGPSFKTCITQQKTEVTNKSYFFILNYILITTVIIIRTVSHEFLFSDAKDSLTQTR